MARHPDIPAWLCVGDLGDDDGVYEDVAAPLHWIKGNNESFDYVERCAAEPCGNLFHLPNGVPRQVHTAAIVGVGGTFAPTWYDTDPAALPHPRKGTIKATVLADRRRHFVKAEVEAVKALGQRAADILLTHEAPRPFRIGRMDAGKTPINELIAAVRPKLHLFGHHHRFAEQEVQGTMSICLDLVGRSYLVIDTGTWEYEKLVTP